MALNPKRGNAAVNAEADAVCALLNGGKLQIYDGSQAATADTAIGAQVKLAELTWNATAFAAAVAGVAAANPITTDTVADATGTASWFRALKSDDTKVFDGTVGTGTHDLVLDTTSIVAGADVAVTAFTYTANKG